MLQPSDYDRFLPDPSPVHDSTYSYHSTLYRMFINSRYRSPYCDSLLKKMSRKYNQRTSETGRGNVIGIAAGRELYCLGFEFR
jgi:hypothetical protein